MSVLQWSFDTYFRHVRDAVVIVDNEGKVQYLNPAAEVLTRDPLGIIRHPLCDLVRLKNDRDCQSFQQMIGDLAQGNRDEFSLQGNICGIGSFDGRSVEIRATPLGRRDRPVLGAMLTISFQDPANREDAPTIDTVHLEDQLKERTAELLISMNLMDEHIDAYQKVEEDRRESEERFRALFQNSKDVIWVLSREGRILQVNPSVTEVFGYPRDEMIQMPIHRLFADPKEGLDLNRKREEGESIVDQEVTLNHRDGRQRICLLSSNPRRNQSGEILEHQEIIRDITSWKYAQEALQKSEERYALAAQAAHDGLWDWDLDADQIYYSSRWCEILGVKEGDLEPRPSSWFNQIHSEDYPDFKASLQAHLISTQDRFESEHRLKHCDGTYRWVRCRGSIVREADGRPRRLVGSLTDISTRKELEETLQNQAFTDTLTGLANFRAMQDRLQKLCNQGPQTNGSSFILALLTLDRYSVYRNRLGREAAHQVIVAVANRLKETLSADTFIARLEGPEFCIIMDGAREEEEAKALTAYIRQITEIPFEARGQEIYETISTGIAQSSPGLNLPEELLRRAEMALEYAMREGKGTVNIFTSAMARQTTAVVQMESDLRKALHQKELQLYYQPIVSLTTGRISGFETLLRWIHPVRGLVMPGDFIPLAEKTGLVADFDLWAIGEGCRQLASWRKVLPPKASIMLSMNLSGVNFMKPDLIMKIEAAMRKYGIHGNSLKLEITETVLVENLQFIQDILAYLKGLDIRLSIDDFGTGYSSLSYLSELPVDVLKIDRSFVMGLGKERKAREIVRTIVDLAHNMQMQVVAEGVEEVHHLHQLKELGCEYAQGYLFAKPLEVKQAEALLLSGKTW
ncbi:MAG TPA: EAL domain-containing protein [Thermoanaerobaculia bacterium]|nr:EAL domain-containing protein [Thermoanaerobaculia bacterium]HUM31119.1 EAL domain-containing protein [Thermoanaerobaculia bacterium]HXK69482.1 EAL domain-containing protein [Thermoanaerobaculia bacterium]